MVKAGQFKKLIPFSARRRLAGLRVLSGAWRWLPILLASRLPADSRPRVFYGLERIPKSGEPAHGGVVKFQWMQALYPNSPRQFNILYMVSSGIPPDALPLVWLARRKGAKVVWNQNGVAYAGWHGPGWEWVNRPMSKLLHAADYVFFQSEFCKRSADRFLGVRQEPWEILYNPVDTTHFAPPKNNPALKQLVLLLGGSQNERYRLETALQTVAVLRKMYPQVRLLVTGNILKSSNKVTAQDTLNKMVNQLKLDGHVIYIGPYSQQEAPAIYHRAHILLHTQYNDASPGLVAEAMACGLPVVYSCSGGVPELVGPDAGIGVSVEQSWEHIFPPSPYDLAEAVCQVAERRSEFSAAARQRAVDKFDLQPWLNRHREVFETLLEQKD